MPRGRIIRKEITDDGKRLTHFIDKHNVVWFNNGSTTEHASLSHLKFCVMHPYGAVKVYMNWELFKYAETNGNFMNIFTFREDKITFPEYW